MFILCTDLIGNNPEDNPEDDPEDDNTAETVGKLHNHYNAECICVL